MLLLRRKTHILQLSEISSQRLEKWGLQWPLSFFSMYDEYPYIFINPVYLLSPVQSFPAVHEEPPPPVESQVLSLNNIIYGNVPSCGVLGLNLSAFQNLLFCFSLQLKSWICFWCFLNTEMFSLKEFLDRYFCKCD